MIQNKFLLTCALLLFAAVCVFPQDSANNTGSQSSTQEKNNDIEYDPYTDEEFPPFLHGIRRSEVLFFGSIPVAYLYCNLGYMAYSQATGVSMESEDKNYMLLYASLSVSAAVVILDYILGKLFD